MAGLFCASLNQLDDTKTAQPAFSFSSALSDSHHLTHGLLPLEHPCTENLTPLLALLPCRSEAGLASLLKKPHKLFDANYQKLAFHVLPVMDSDGSDIIAQIINLEVEIVHDPIRSDRMQGRKGRRDWSLTSLFGAPTHALTTAPDLTAGTVTRLCPVSSSSRIRLALGAVVDRDERELLPPVDVWQQADDGYYQLDLSAGQFIRYVSEANLIAVQNACRFSCRQNGRPNLHSAIVRFLEGR